MIRVGRGGGSIEALWAFNDEFVVRIVAASPVPIIAGVGHETDFTLTDFAADLRAATPTAAAELATPITINELGGAINYYTEKLKTEINSLLDRNYVSVDDLHTRLRYASPMHRIQQETQKLDGQILGLNATQAQSQGLMGERLNGLNRRLDALNPHAVLARGYAIVTRQLDGKIVGSVDDVRKNEDLKIHVKDGEFEAKII